MAQDRSDRQSHPMQSVRLWAHARVQAIDLKTEPIGAVLSPISEAPGIEHEADPMLQRLPDSRGTRHGRPATRSDIRAARSDRGHPQPPPRQSEDLAHAGHVRGDADGVALLGGPSNPGKVLIRLATAWEVADDLFRTSLAILSIDDEQFLRKADDIERSFRNLMQRAMPGSVIPAGESDRES